jgi:hypothetical protein
MCSALVVGVGGARRRTEGGREDGMGSDGLGRGEEGATRWGLVLMVVVVVLGYLGG